MVGCFKKSKKKNVPSQCYSYIPDVHSIINSLFRRYATSHPDQDQANVEVPPNSATNANCSSSPDKLGNSSDEGSTKDYMIAASCPVIMDDMTNSCFAILGDSSDEGLTKANITSSPAKLSRTLDFCFVYEEPKTSRIPIVSATNQEEAFPKVCGFLGKCDVGMIGIYGMGGVGKTTFMKKVCSQFLQPSSFMVVWVTISRNVDLNSIQRCIMRELSLPYEEDKDMVARGMEINLALSLNKTKLIALLLDDIWEAVDLENLGVSGGIKLDTSRFKIIFTTRSEDVCLRMKPDQMIKMECLGWNESWELFKDNVGEETLNFHDRKYHRDAIFNLARLVARECGGLPLALTVVAKAMVSRTSVGAWQDALKNLKNSGPLLINETDKNLFECLKLSYDNLDSPVEKECFLFCCIYSEDEEISRASLVESWIGEGLLEVSFGTYQETCNRGQGIIDTLVAKSLLEVKNSSSTILKMHDIIRDMGLWISSQSNFFMQDPCLDLKEKTIMKRWNKARRVRVEGHYHDIPEKLDCPELSTLHIYPRNGYDIKIDLSNKFWNSLCFIVQMKTLILSCVTFEDPEIPRSTLGLLVQLRHLEIKKTNMSALPPDIGNLRKLMALKLVDNMDLTTLPTTIGELCELRNLKIWGTFLTRVPSNGSLTKLEIAEIWTTDAVMLPKGLLYDLRRLKKLHITFKWNHESIDHNLLAFHC